MPSPGALTRQRVGLDDVAPGHLRAADAAVVRPLGRGEALLGPAVGSAVLEERVLLLDAELRLEARELLRDATARARLFVACGVHVGIEDLAHHQDVVRSAQGVGADEDRLEHAVREVTGRLVRARSVEAPHGRLLAVGDDLGLAAQLAQSARFRQSRCIQPDTTTLLLRCVVACSRDRLQSDGSRAIADP